MTTASKYLERLKTPAAQVLLQSTIPARLAYIGIDATPRVLPIWFYWNGTTFILSSRMGSPKVKALQKNPAIALTIDTENWPYKSLQIRGIADIEVVDGIVPEYSLMAHRYYGTKNAQLWLQRMHNVTSQMARIIIQPDWVRVMDFEQLFPDIIRGKNASDA